MRPPPPVDAAETPRKGKGKRAKVDWALPAMPKGHQAGLLRLALGRGGGAAVTGGGLVPGVFAAPVPGPPPAQPAPGPLSGWINASSDAAAAVAALEPGGEKFLEIALPGSVTESLGSTAVMRVVAIKAATNDGVELELEMVGCSCPEDLLRLGPLFLGDMAGAVAHCCFAAGGGCTMAAGPRTVLHFLEFKMRSVASLVEPWLGAVGVAVRLLAKGPLVKAVVVAPVRPDAEALPGGGAAPKVETDSAQVELLKEKLKAVKKRCEEQSVSSILASKAKKRRVDVNSDSESEDKGGKDSGLSIMEVAEKNPVELFRSGMVEISKVLTARGGGSGSDSADTVLAPVVVQYLNSIWHGEFPQSKVGKTRCRELRTMAECLDALLRGQLPRLGDLLMQRFQSLQIQTADGTDDVSQYLEIIPRTSSSLAAETVIRAALKERLSVAKLSRAQAKPGAASF